MMNNALRLMQKLVKTDYFATSTFKYLPLNSQPEPTIPLAHTGTINPHKSETCEGLACVNPYGVEP